MSANSSPAYRLRRVKREAPWHDLLKTRTTQGRLSTAASSYARGICRAVWFGEARHARPMMLL